MALLLVRFLRQKLSMAASILVLPIRLFLGHPLRLGCVLNGPRIVVLTLAVALLLGVDVIAVTIIVIDAITMPALPSFRTLQHSDVFPGPSTSC